MPHDETAARAAEPRPPTSEPAGKPSPQQMEQWLGAEVCRELGLYPIPEGLRLSVVIPVYNE